LAQVNFIVVRSEVLVLENIINIIKMGKKVAIVVTSADKLGDKTTGLWLEECAAPYYVFKEAGMDIDILSVQGGCPPIDPGSLGGDFYTPATKKFKEEDPDAWKLFENSKKIDAAAVEGYDGLFFSGGHGTCVDFKSDAVVKAVEKFYTTGKPMAAVCHGPVAFLSAKTPEGEPIVKGLKVTGFSVEEEDMVGLTGTVEYVPETKIKELGGIYEKAEGAWGPKAVRDGKIITGQNPGSSEPTAKLLAEALA